MVNSNLNSRFSKRIVKCKEDFSSSDLSILTHFIHCMSAGHMKLQHFHPGTVTGAGLTLEFVEHDLLCAIIRSLQGPSERMFSETNVGRL